MAQLIPAILTKDPGEVSEKLEFLDGIQKIKEVKIDFEDGRFVENTTIMPKDLWGVKTRFKIEAHLMVAFPQAYFHDLEILNPRRGIFHYESFFNSPHLASSLQNLKAMGFER